MQEVYRLRIPGPCGEPAIEVGLFSTRELAHKVGKAMAGAEDLHISSVLVCESAVEAARHLVLTELGHLLTPDEFKQVVRERAMAKLSTEEKEVLGLAPSRPASPPLQLATYEEYKWPENKYSEPACGCGRGSCICEEASK
jgi:hypothetical protein